MIQRRSTGLNHILSTARDAAYFDLSGASTGRNGGHHARTVHELARHFSAKVQQFPPPRVERTSARLSQLSSALLLVPEGPARRERERLKLDWTLGWWWHGRPS